MAQKSRVRIILGALAAAGGVGGAYLYSQQKSDRPKCDNSRDGECSTNSGGKTKKPDNSDQNPAIYFPSLISSGENSQEAKGEEERKKGMSGSNEQQYESSTSVTSWFPTFGKKSAEAKDFHERSGLFSDSKIYASSTEQAGESSVTKKEGSHAAKSPKKSSEDFDANKVEESQKVHNCST